MHSRLIILFGLICLLAQQTKAQNQVLIDSLEKELAKVKEDTNAVNVLNDLAFEYRGTDIEKAFSLLNRSIKLSEKLHFTSGLALAYNHLGILNKNQHHFEDAIHYHEQALKLRQQLHDEEGMASSYNNLGLTYDTKSDYVTAMKWYIESLRIREKMKDSSGMSASYNNIARIYAKKGNSKEAITNNQKAIRLREQIGDSFWVGQYTSMQGFLHYELNEYETALSYFKRSLKILEAFGDEAGSSQLMNNIGNVLGETGKVDESIQYHLKALKIQQANEDSIGIYTSLVSLCQIYGIKHDYLKAIQYGKEALKILPVFTGEHKMYMDYYEVVGELYKKQGNYKDALNAYLEYNRYKDSLRQSETNTAVLDVQAKYETEKKDLELSKKDLALTKADYELKKKNAVTISLAIFIIIAIVLSYLFYNRYKLKKEKELNALIIKQQEIRSKAIIDAEEKERIRIAKDLHDGIGQQLSALKFNFSSLHHLFETDEAYEMKYATLIQMIDDAVKEVRSVSHDMMPNALLRSGLVAATREFIDKIAMNGLLKVDLQIIGLNKRLENTVETVIYRVLQEAVNNIIKHAQASKISIQLIKHENSLNLILEDNGKGFDTNLINEFKGIGLKNIVSRIEYLNGSVNFDSFIGRGTTIDIEVPL
jgi:two-component system, NarL family, sensor kinase